MSDRSGNGAGQAEGHSTSTSSSLLGRVKANDKRAWERLVALYGPTVFG